MSPDCATLALLALALFAGFVVYWLTIDNDNATLTDDDTPDTTE